MTRQPPILPALRCEPLRTFLVKLDELEAAFEDLPVMDKWKYRAAQRNIEALRSTMTAQLSTLERDLIGAG